MSSPGDIEPISDAAPELAVNLRALARKIVIACVVIEIILVLLDLIFNFGKLTTITPVRRILNITREDCVATWFGSTQLFLVGLTATLIYCWHRGIARSTDRAGWAIFALFFFYMAVDDAVAIHETVGSAFKRQAAQSVAGPAAAPVGEVSQIQIWISKFPTYYWQLVFVPIFGLIGLYMLYFLWRRAAVPRLRAALIAGLSCYVVAVGLDFVEGLEGGYQGIMAALNCTEYQVSHISKVIEEFLEMVGTTLIWYGFIVYLAALMDGLSLRFHDSDKEEESQIPTGSL